MQESDAKTSNQILSVLVIDDEEMIRELARDVLEMNGFTTLCAENGMQGVATYEEHREKIGCIILDLTMPEMSGLETYSKLKEINTDVKIILSTGHGRDRDAQEIIARGVLGVIQKPYRIEELVLRVRETLTM